MRHSHRSRATRLIAPVRRPLEFEWLVALFREIALEGLAPDDWRALVSTRRFTDEFAALQAFRPHWRIKNNGGLEPKKGFGLGEQ